MRIAARKTKSAVIPRKRVRLCLKDLYHTDIVEMIERETRQFSVWDIEDPEDPDFLPAYQMLWDAFGPAGEMERIDAIRRFLLDDPNSPVDTGTFCKYFLLAAKDRDGNMRGARDGSVLVNQAYDPTLCVVYLSHIFMKPEARGTVLSYWLRIAPVEIAMRYLETLHAQGKIVLPSPDQPAKHFGMRIVLAAEMEFFDPSERISWQRILFYGRGGFDVINPRHFPYRQPDFRDPEVIKQTGNQPVPFMLLVRRIGHERQATMPIREASALMRLLYDDFAYHCAPEFLENSLEIVLQRLAAREKRKAFVELLPLPTGPRDLHRLKPLFRYTAYQKHYGLANDTEAYLNGPVKQRLKEDPHYLEHALADIAHELEKRSSQVYAKRDRGFTWTGEPIEDLE